MLRITLVEVISQEPLPYGARNYYSFELAKGALAILHILAVAINHQTRVCSTGLLLGDGVVEPTRSYYYKRHQSSN